MRDQERINRVQQGMRDSQLDVLVCALPAHVLLLTGYWPVVGVSVAVAFAHGEIFLLVPEDELWLAQNGWAEHILSFQPASLDRLQSTAEAILPHLTAVLGKSSRARIGLEHGPDTEPASYAAMYLYAGGMRDLIAQAAPSAHVEPADSLLANLAAVKTSEEIDRIRTACAIAAEAFTHGAAAIQPGMSEAEIASVVRDQLSVRGLSRANIRRAGGFAFCMSGPNSAKAGAAYAHSSSRPLAPQDLVLVHCNSYADGFWSDITRTYCLGAPDTRQRRMYEAIFEARQSALHAIRPGVRASGVDQAARQTLARFGFERQFTHATGHGVGFAAIGHNARPRIHPRSEETLERGMVFNVEPAIYLEGDCGMRHCDVVAVSRDGFEVLTTFQSEVADLILGSSPRHKVA
jgi:Xaa-Pro aminopeptidase